MIALNSQQLSIIAHNSDTCMSEKRTSCTINQKLHLQKNSMEKKKPPKVISKVL